MNELLKIIKIWEMTENIHKKTQQQRYVTKAQ